MEPFSPMLLAALLAGVTLVGGCVACWRGHDFLEGAAAGLIAGILLAISLVVTLLALM